MTRVFRNRATGQRVLNFICASRKNRRDGGPLGRIPRGGQASERTVPPGKVKRKKMTAVTTRLPPKSPTGKAIFVHGTGVCSQFKLVYSLLLQRTRC